MQCRGSRQWATLWSRARHRKHLPWKVLLNSGEGGRVLMEVVGFLCRRIEASANEAWSEAREPRFSFTNCHFGERLCCSCYAVPLRHSSAMGSLRRSGMTNIDLSFARASGFLASGSDDLLRERIVLTSGCDTQQ
jgi:hypothetical protein